ncbi:MAG: YitT family protein [Clostridiales bacterium]|nr:YitT family protein [Clostridiales bacterium]
MVTKKELEEADIIRKTSNGKQTAKSVLIAILGVLCAGVIRAISVYSFVVPNNFAPGGVTGLASILEYKTHINAGYFLAIFNVPLMIVAFIFINKRFVFISTSFVIFSSALMVLFEKINFPVFDATAKATDQVLPALAGGILGGTGIAIMLKIGGSCGGTDIIATIIQRKQSAANVPTFIFMMDSTVVIASAFIYPNSIVPVLVSFVEMFASSRTAETILQGFKSAIKFEVITDKPEELAKAIFDKLRRGVTMLEAKGMYTGEKRALLVCIISKRQMSKFREVLKQFPDSFAYVGSTSEVVGKWGAKQSS